LGVLYKKGRSIKTKEYLYPGAELELFSYAINWKSYFKKHLIPYVQGRVLEVGAGIGETSKFLQNTKVSHWTYLEPDRRLFSDLVKKNCGSKSDEFICGTTEDIKEKNFDTILYIDVLEHIEDDLNELKFCSRLLAKNGRIIILSPAHNILFSQFDKSIGHFRRYNHKMLKNLEYKDLRLKQYIYLDSLGLFLNLCNKLILKKSIPNIKQILFWDRCIVPISKLLDPILGKKFGKTIIGIFEVSKG